MADNMNEPKKGEESPSDGASARSTSRAGSPTEPKTRESSSVSVSPANDFKQVAPPKEPYTAYSQSRQLFIVLIATLAGFFAPLCGAVYLPSLVLFQDVFHTSRNVVNATVSVYMAFFAVTPLFGAAASDYGGRKTVYLCSLAIFLVANTLLAAILSGEALLSE
jgi:Co/Zn/Cd efflux system component